MKDSTPVRKGSFDLLRIILILMVCTLHACGRFDALFLEGTVPDAARYAGMVLESLSIVAVNTWVIMSGYLLVKKEFKRSRFLELLVTVIFYAALGFIVVWLLSKTSAPFAFIFSTEISRVTGDGVFSVMQALFPISAEYYWFMTCYLLLYILTPILNKGARALTKKQYRTLLLLLLIWTSLIKSIVPVSFVTDNGGYDLKWFVCLYLIGAYFRLEEIGFVKDDDSLTSGGHKGGKLRALWLYLGSAVLIYLSALVLYRVNISTGRFAYFMTVPMHYNFILTLTGACGLFLWFKNMEIKSGPFMKAVSNLSGHTLGVYLLHAHPLLFYSWPVLITSLLGEIPRSSVLLLVVYVLASIVILFVCGILADMVRSLIFSVFEKLHKR